MIAAAGSGRRLGAGGPKAFVALAGRTLLEWSLIAVDAARRVDAIVIAAPPGHEEDAERIARGVLPEAELAVHPGGDTRAESVAGALAAVGGELLLVHDAARPLLDPALADRVLARLEADPEADAAIAALPLTDTIKRAREPREGPDEPAPPVAETLDRSYLWAAQTPQAFRVAALRDAQLQARSAGYLGEASDEAWLIERAGGRVLLEPAPATNLKITTAADLTAATALLAVAGASPG